MYISPMHASPTSTKEYTDAPLSAMLQEIPEVGLLGAHASHYQITRDTQLILKF